MDLFDAYRIAIARPDDGELCWWYFGEIFNAVDGFPDIHAASVTTIMFYKVKTLSPDAFQLDWTEIGVLSNPVTGEVGGKWINPITGVQAAMPNGFIDGPGRYTIRRKGSSGIAFALEQKGAVIKKIQLKTAQRGGRLMLSQDEFKSRGGGDGHTNLWTSVNLAELNAAGRPWVDSVGSYTYTNTALTGWGGFGGLRGLQTVKGMMVKGDYRAKMNPTAWQRLRQLYPNYFAGEGLRPVWP